MPFVQSRDCLWTNDKLDWPPFGCWVSILAMMVADLAQRPMRNCSGLQSLLLPMSWLDHFLPESWAGACLGHFLRNQFFALCCCRNTWWGLLYHASPQLWMGSWSVESLPSTCLETVAKNRPVFFIHKNIFRNIFSTLRSLCMASWASLVKIEQG